MRPFTDVLREMRKGRIVDQASEMLAELVRAVDATDKAGTLTVKLTVKPDKSGGREKVLSAVVTSSVPRHELPDAIFFSDVDGNLSRNDPDQREMFTDVERPGLRDASA